MYCNVNCFYCVKSKKPLLRLKEMFYMVVTYDELLSESEDLKKKIAEIGRKIEEEKVRENIKKEI